jgi:hypothetical protein
MFTTECSENHGENKKQEDRKIGRREKSLKRPLLASPALIEFLSQTIHAPKTGADKTGLSTRLTP